MAKYIDADRLREKLTERLDLFKELSSDTISPIRIDECKKIIGIIDSLQQEQSEVDLEKIIEQTYHDGSVADTDDIDHATYENIVRHFYELGQRDAANKFDESEYNRRRMEEEMSDKDLNEVAEEYFYRNWSDGSLDIKPQVIEDFKAGAEWALNQGVKATGTIYPRGIIYDNNIWYRLFSERYHNGDKVIVQIRKKEGSK